MTQDGSSLATVLCLPHPAAILSQHPRFCLKILNTACNMICQSFARLAHFVLSKAIFQLFCLQATYSPHMQARYDILFKLHLVIRVTLLSTLKYVPHM